MKPQLWQAGASINTYTPSWWCASWSIHCRLQLLYPGLFRGECREGTWGQEFLLLKSSVQHVDWIGCLALQAPSVCGSRTTCTSCLSNSNIWILSWMIVVLFLIFMSSFSRSSRLDCIEDLRSSPICLFLTEEDGPRSGCSFVNRGGWTYDQLKN